MQETTLETVIINPKSTAKAAVIWLHGLGADAHDFIDIVPELKLPEEMAVKFVFPEAPFRSVTLNSGMTMRAWFDIYGLTANSLQDEEGIREIDKAIYQLVEQQIAEGIPSRKVILAGFSQGGAMALHTGLRYPQPLGGILGLSTFLPLADYLVDEAAAPNKNTPIMLTHGNFDPIISIHIAQKCKEKLEELGYPVLWRTYPMAHGVCPEEICDISQWIQSTLVSTIPGK